MSTADEAKQTPDASELQAKDMMPAAVPSLGMTLRAARERKGLSQEQVVKDTLIIARYVKALEADDFDDLPGPTFARGYLRRYAELLALSANDLVAEFDVIWNARQPSAIPLADGKTHALKHDSVSNLRTKRRASMFAKTARQFSITKLLSYGSVLLLVALLIASVFWNDSTPIAPMTNIANDLALTPEPAVEDVIVPTPIAVEAAAPAVIPAAADDAAAPTLPNATLTPVTEPLATSSASAPVASPAASTAPTPAATPVITPVTPTTAPMPVSSDTAGAATSASVPAVVAPPPRIDSLSFSFSGKSWISVRDATGQELVYGLKNSGQSVTVTGQPPFAINIGSVKDTQMSRNGVPVNLKPYTRGEIASFRLGR